MNPLDIHSNTWDEFFSERTVRPCSSCHVELKNIELRERLSSARAVGKRNAWKAYHWDIWQRSQPAPANLRHAIARVRTERPWMFAGLLAILACAIFGAADFLVYLIVAIQQVMR